MSLSPILKALSLIRTSGVRTLLMGGQACVFYGAAEFSRDLDLLVPADAASLDLLRKGLDLVGAEAIAVPTLDGALLERGHAVHFRCRRDEVTGLRIDVMPTLRGVDGFEPLWARRTTILVDGIEVDMLSMQDLVCAKKTQRDKDWPMIRRLLEQAYFSWPAPLGEERIEYLLREVRSSELLPELVRSYPEAAERVALARLAVRHAVDGNANGVALALAAEEAIERAKDRIYWEPLKRELEQFRRERRNTID